MAVRNALLASPGAIAGLQSFNADPLIATREAAAFLGVSIAAMVRWRRDGAGRCRVGGLVRYRRSATEAFVAAGKRKPQQLASA
jgi:hypothetical protein